MNVDEFLDRELADLDIDTGKAEKTEDNSDFPTMKIVESSHPFNAAELELTKANIEQAEQTYMNLWHSLTQQKLKWDKDIYEQLLKISRQFSAMLNTTYDELKNQSNRINELIGRARSYLQAGKKEIALRAYAEIQKISNSVPNVFFEEKRRLQDQVSSFYSELTAAADAELVKKVSGMLHDINQKIEKINGLVSSNDVENASAEYLRCIEMYNQIPEGFLNSKNSVGIRILEVYKNLSVSAEISALQRHLIIPKPEPRMNYYRQPSATEKPGYSASKTPGILSPPPLPGTPIAGHAHSSFQQKSAMVNNKREQAKKNIRKGFFNEAWKDIEGALQIDPDDVESKALKAKVKTLQ